MTTADRHALTLLAADALADTMPPEDLLDAVGELDDLTDDEFAALFEDRPATFGDLAARPAPVSLPVVFSEYTLTQSRTGGPKAVAPGKPPLYGDDAVAAVGQGQQPANRPQGGPPEGAEPKWAGTIIANAIPGETGSASHVHLESAPGTDGRPWWRYGTDSRGAGQWVPSADQARRDGKLYAAREHGYETPEERRAKVIGKAEGWKSKAKVDLDVSDSDVEKVAAKWKSFAGDIPAAASASLVGAPDDASVKLGLTEKGNLAVTVKHPAFTARRILMSKDGERYVYNDSFFMAADKQGGGLGARVFADQVEACRAAGLTSIKCHAAKENPEDYEKPHIGYYVWPRFGYDMSLADDKGIHESDAKTYAAAREKFPEAKTVLDVMSTPEGRKWWKQNGTDALNMRFDLSNGSRSMKVFQAYQAEKAKLAA